MRANVGGLRCCGGACSQVAVLQDSLCVACNSQWKFTQGEEANLAAGSDEDTDLEGLIEESTAATMEELEVEPTSSPVPRCEPSAFATPNP